MASVTNRTAANMVRTWTRFGVSIPEAPLVGQRLLAMIVYVNGCWPIRVPRCGGRGRAPESQADRPPLGKDEGRDPDRGARAFRRRRLRAGDHSGHRRGRWRAIFATQVMPAVAPLCRDRATAATRIGLVATQMLGMALCRYVLRLPPVVALDRAAVIRWLAPAIQRYLTGSP